MATLPNFGTNGGGAAFGNPKLARQGQKAGATQATPTPTTTTPPPTTSAPPKASAAPSVNKNIAVGLMDFLNNTEEKLVKDGVFEVANVYSVEFAPAALGDARVTKEGKPNKAKVPMQQAKDPADKVNPDSNSVDYNVRTFGITAGQPIITVIDQILKNSTYIADQAAYIVDEVTQETKPQKPIGDLVWYKVSVEATPILPYDKKRLDYAYNIKYVISAYPINSMLSEYFPQSKVRGKHKSYKYWFTGQNTQVLRFEQKFNSLYKTTFNNPNILTDTNKKNNRDTPGREYQAAVASSSSQGAEGLTNSIGASAADYLYSPTDIAKCELTIVGDPAWLQQGEAATGISSLNYNFSPFNADGSINFDAQQIVFDLQWNPGVDYDLTGTGLANPNVSSAPQAIYTYVATEVTSKFSRGKFEQELKGTQIDVQDPNSKTPAASASAATSSTSAASGQSERDDAAAVDAAAGAAGAGVRTASIEKAIPTEVSTSLADPAALAAQSERDDAAAVDAAAGAATLQSNSTDTAATADNVQRTLTTSNGEIVGSSTTGNAQNVGATQTAESQEIVRLQRDLVQLETDLANSLANPALADLVPSQQRTVQRTKDKIAELQQRVAASVPTNPNSVNIPSNQLINRET